jgi:hypothetical protein
LPFVSALIRPEHRGLRFVAFLLQIAYTAAFRNCASLAL